MGKRMTTLAAGLVAALCMAMPASAVYTGSHYAYDDWGQAVPAPESHEALAVLSGADCGAGALSSPEDLFTAGNGSVYIADTGNHRVVELDAQLRFRRSIDRVQLPEGESPLLSPKGVFLAADGSLYIADTGNGRVLRLDGEGNVLRIFERPQTELIAADMEFQPEKVAVDSGGSVYVVAYGVYQGMIEYDGAGNFTGFFGSNRIEPTLEVLTAYFWKKLLSKEQGESLTRLIPTQYANLFIDDRDFIYTATSETETSTDEVKKLSALGVNVLRPPGGQLYNKRNFADLEMSTVKGVAQDSRVVDVHVDEQGIISLLDQRRGRVFQYNQDCQLLFVFGDLGTQRGTFKRPTALGRQGDRYLVLDGDKNAITVFAMTDYARSLREAVGYYNDGKYEESVALWEALLQENGNLSMAYQSIGKARLQQRDYRSAMDCFERGNDRKGYSDALREYRKQVIRTHFWWMALAAAAVLFLLARLVRRIRVRLGFPVRGRRRRIR